ncbi:MAG: hypothetical protein HDQ95_16345 [Roseburia sp.]|nr:hypothetical protein [Roseburia sp.]
MGETGLKKTEEYIEKLRALAEQAEKDGSECKKRFLEQIMEKKPENLELFDFIYKTNDDLTEPLADFFSYLVSFGLPLEWYEIGSVVSDEKTHAEEYLQEIRCCIEKNIAAEEIRSALSDSSDISDFAIKVRHNDEKISNKPELEGERETVIKHLIDENTQLNARLDSVMKELNTSRQEVKSLMEEVYAGRRSIQEYRTENEQLKKDTGRAVLAIRLEEGKTAKYQAMAEQLEAINVRIRLTNKEIEEELAVVRQELLEREDTVKELEEKLFEQKRIMEEIRNEAASEVEKVATSQEIDTDSIEPFREEEDQDYPEGDVIVISDNRPEIQQHSNLFVSVLSKFYEIRFAKKTQADQDNLIFIKMMEKNFSMDMVQLIKKALKDNDDLSRLDLYRLISQNASDTELTRFCGIAA